jgi:hypothetical protein
MTNVIEELRSRRQHKPFVPFVIVRRGGQRHIVNRKFQYAFTDDRVVVLDERDLSDFFPPSEIVAIDSLQAVA